MTITDREQLLRAALVTILEADATIASLCGGTSRVFDTVAELETAALPAIGYEIVDYSYASGRARVRLTAIANSTTASETVRALLEAAEAALSYPAFAGQSLDVAPLTEAAVRSVGIDPQDIERLARLAGTPNLRVDESEFDLEIYDAAGV